MVTSHGILTPGFFAKEGFNRIRLRKAWSDAAGIITKARFDRLVLNYGDSRKNTPGAKRKWLSEGLKICR